MPRLKTLGILLLTSSAAWGCGNSTDETPLLAAQTGGDLAPTGGTSLTGGAGGSGGVMDASGGTPVATGGVDTAAPSVNSDLPCDVQEALSTYCWKCHGEKTDWGGPMSLVTKAQFDAMGKNTPSARVDALVKARINDAARPMPPLSAPQMPQEAKDTLNAWLDQGAPVGDGTPCTVTPPEGTGGMVGTGGSEGTGGTTSGQWQEYDTSWPGGVKPQETCYQFIKHGGQTPGDTTPHVAPDGETYLNFFYKVPWTEPVVATRWRTLYDKTQILHHWLLYRSPAEASRDGNWETGVGVHPGAQLLAVWAVGGGDEDFPPGVGLRLPEPGSMLEVEWHLYNTTGGTVEDRSGIEVCVVPESAVKPEYVAGVHWLGTEALGFIAPNTDSKRGGICSPQMSPGEKATIVKWMPHMHLKGVHMDTWILREDGSEEHIFDKPFNFDQQIMYAQETPLEINPGDRIHTQCTFRNDGSGYIYYGESTNNEMCYQFVFAYPAGSLDNTSTPSLSGAVNSCLSGNITHP